MRASLLGRFSSLTVLSAALLFPLQPALADGGGAGQSQPVSPELLEQATAYLQFRNSAVVSLDAGGLGQPMVVPAIPMTDTFLSEATDAWESQAERRVRLAGKGVRYTEARTRVAAVSAVTTADGLDVTVDESTELVYAHSDGEGPPFTAYHMEIVLSFIDTTEGLALAGNRPANEAGLMPPTMVAPKIYLDRSTSSDRASDDGGSDPIKVNIVPRDIHLTNPGVSVPQVELLEAPGTSEEECGEFAACTPDDQVNVFMKFPPSLTIGNVSASTPEGEYKELLLESGPEPDNRPAGLEYRKMLEYAVTHYDNYNSDFRSFDNDCTNFHIADPTHRWLETRHRPLQEQQ